MPIRADRFPSRRPGCAPWLPCLVVALALSLGAGKLSFAESPEPVPPLQKVVVKVGMNRRTFSQLNENDATAAYKIFCAEIGRKLGYDLTAEMNLFDSPPDFAQAIRTGRVDFMPMGTWELLSMNVEETLDIEFSAVGGGRALRRWLLLVRRDSRLTHVAELKGQHALLLHNNMATLADPWLETCLLELGLGAPEQFFGRLDTVLKPSSAVLPVFFGKAQACVVDQAAFDVMVEMNPQVGEILVPLAQSEPMLDGIVCLNRLGWSSAKARQDMVRALSDLDLEPPGRQVLTLFKCERLVRFEPAQLDAVRRLYARHAALQKGSAP